MTLLLLALPNNDRMSQSLESSLNKAGPQTSEHGLPTLRRFPDGET